MLSGQSLNAATSTGPGTAIMFDVPRVFASMQVEVTGGQAQVNLEGTLDGTTWAPVGATTGAGFVGIGTGMGSSLPQTVALLGIRANFAAINSGSPVVTAYVAAAG